MEQHARLERRLHAGAGGGFTFDPEQPAGGLPTAKLTPEYQAKMLKRIEGAKQGIEWDPISTCAPPGHPRWLTEPFLREFIVTPDQTWLINEMVNDIRRIYTDGRDHVPEADRYPLYNGDSIGFWDGDRLVIHTNQLQAGIYQRSQSGLHRPGGDRRDLARRSIDEDARRRRVGLRSAGARGAVVHEAVLPEAERSGQEPAHPLLALRREPEQHASYQTKEGATAFPGFTFAKKDDKQGDKP